jgi:hypothetical protein
VIIAMPSGIDIVFGQNHIRILAIFILSLNISPDIRCERHPI